MKKNNQLILGSRGSPLALWQTHKVKKMLLETHSDLNVEIKIIQTKGDKILDRPLADIGDKGLFTKELEYALAEGSIDAAVHSLKDLPTELPPSMRIGAILERSFPEDVLISRVSEGLKDLPLNALVGTGSARRKNQLSHLRGDLRFDDLRGNIQTRLKKLESGQYDAIVMARAALERMDLQKYISHVFSVDEILPAVGQGALAIEVCDTFVKCEPYFKGIHHIETGLKMKAERRFLKRLGGGCEKPIAAFATLDGQELTLKGYLSSTDGSRQMYNSLIGNANEAEILGENLAKMMLNEGGADILNLS